MKVESIHAKDLENKGLFSKHDKTEIYKDRKIERLDTSRNIINKYSSGGKVSIIRGQGKNKEVDLIN